jgi:hypothetical protein
MPITTAVGQPVRRANGSHIGPNPMPLPLPCEVVAPMFGIRFLRRVHGRESTGRPVQPRGCSVIVEPTGPGCPALGIAAKRGAPCVARRTCSDTGQGPSQRPDATKPVLSCNR